MCSARWSARLTAKGCWHLSPSASVASRTTACVCKGSDLYVRDQPSIKRFHRSDEEITYSPIWSAETSNLWDIWWQCHQIETVLIYLNIGSDEKIHWWNYLGVKLSKLGCWYREVYGGFLGLTCPWWENLWTWKSIICVPAQWQPHYNFWLMLTTDVIEIYA